MNHPATDNTLATVGSKLTLYSWLLYIGLGKLVELLIKISNTPSRVVVCQIVFLDLSIKVGANRFLQTESWLRVVQRGASLWTEHLRVGQGAAQTFVCVPAVCFISSFSPLPYI